MAFDARVMKALGSVGVSVPKTLALCEDSRLVNNFLKSSALPNELLFCFLAKWFSVNLNNISPLLLSSIKQPDGI